MNANVIAIAAVAATLVTGGVALIINKRRAKKNKQLIMDRGVFAVQSIMAAHPNNEAVQNVGKEAITAMQSA